MDTVNKVKMDVNMDAVDINKLIAYEEGALDDVETIAFFQEGISAGWVWQLQGHYVRTARVLIDLGYCTEPADPYRVDEPTTATNVGATA